MSENQRIEGRAKTVREVLDKAKYDIDFYQREYAWEERQVRELIDDLTGKFLDFWDEDHARVDVETYGHYFLGSIVVSHKRGKRFIVDGQQRLTTLTLLLIHLHHLQTDRDDTVDVRNLVFSEKFGSRSFNLNVRDREGVMEAVLNGKTYHPEGEPDSVRNILERYGNIGDHFPEELHKQALPYFVDWLLENVHMVEIEAFSDEDAYTIFETMNDRGLSLSLPDMLKGYILANIRDEADQRRANDIWKTSMRALKELGDDEDVDFFKNWLRGRHAESIRPSTAGAENRDFGRIGNEFHRWVRDQRERLGLAKSEDFQRFVKHDVAFYARQNLRIRRAAKQLTQGLESIRFNEERGFTFQTQLLLGAIDPSEAPEVIDRKLALVADFLDIWIARRVWNFRTISYSSVRYTLFNLTKDIRNRDLESLSTFLRKQLEAQKERFAFNLELRLHQQNYRQVRHLLARMTHWVQTECGMPSTFEDLVSRGRARPFEIEHIWANQYERFAEHFGHPNEFAKVRNRIGGLILIQRGINQSLGDAGYEEKRDAYLAKGGNALAASLHPLAYEKDPDFRRFCERTGLDFQPYETFGPMEQEARQRLYIRLAEWVWNPSRLDLDGVKPPDHLEFGFQHPTAGDGKALREMQNQARRKFFHELLAKAEARTDLFRGNKVPKGTWLSTKAGLSGAGSFAIVLRIKDARVELYIDCGNSERNKVLFDRLAQQRTEIEADFGGALEWHRMEQNRGCSINWKTRTGGRKHTELWGALQDELIDAIIRLDRALRQRLLDAFT